MKPGRAKKGERRRSATAARRWRDRIRRARYRFELQEARRGAAERQ